MSDVLSPPISEFDTQTQADSYQKWFEAKMRAGLNDSRPLIPHDEVMAAARAIIESKKAKHAGS